MTLKKWRILSIILRTVEVEAIVKQIPTIAVGIGMERF